MHSSGSRPPSVASGSRGGATPLWIGLPVLALSALWVAACTELNPHFDPDGGPLCVAGERRCDATGDSIEICTEDATAFEPLRDCFDQSRCVGGACTPNTGTADCERPTDCASDQACTVLVDPLQPDRLGTWCLPAPNPAGRVGGQACTSHAECRSGWCFRQVCFEACVDASDCTNEQHQCLQLNVTVDGVRDYYNIQGCVP